MSITLRGVTLNHQLSCFARLLGAYALFVGLACMAIFILIAGHTFGSALESALVNSIPVFALGFGARAILNRFVFERPLVLQAALHVLLGAAFSLLLYWMIMSAFALLRGPTYLGFIVQPFHRAAGVWQLLQGGTTYALVAAFSWIDRAARSSPAREVAAANDRSNERQGLLLKKDDEIVPVRVGDIVSITGADDYSEIVLIDGRHLAKMSLAAFEKQLSPLDFIRVHRSHIININRLVRAEPAGGGRLLLHMQGSETVPASKSGARLIRQRAV